MSIDFTNGQYPTVTTSEAREILNCSRSTLDRWRKQGRFRAYKVGRTWRYFAEDIANLFKPINQRLSA